jgi:hypothetical protein
MNAIGKITFLLSQILLLLFITACSGSGNRQNSSPTFQNQQPQSNPGGGSSSGVEPVRERITVPSSPRLAPSDIFDQVVFEGTGGGEGGMNCPCLEVYGSTIYLNGFSPNQSIKLVAYDEYEQYYGNYYADWLIKVDSSGSLEITIDGLKRNMVFFAFDQNSGKQLAPRNRIVFPFSRQPSSPSSPSSSSSFARISGEVAEVNMRSSPGYTNKDDSRDVIAKIPSGATVEILDGPYTVDGLNWWHVSWSGKKGYIAEKTGSGRTIMIFNP